MGLADPSPVSEPDASLVEIEGYAAIFGSVDLSGDIVMPGAFSSVTRLSKNLIPDPASRVMMLYQHAVDQPIGRWTEMREDHHGLFVRGHLFADTARGGDLYHLLRRGAIDGLSIGFKPERVRRNRAGQRELHKVALWEVSIVTFPMAPQARITRVSAPGERLPRNLLSTTL
ncbi:HK97 family phage prohead protease [Parvularcula sp. LCG005]|uniref:HK97 family phage prohead protease n=1 Tax=Parvularcula sp. LCG005 TaxID=3078805 RepID=UPI002941FBF5|nr:HK97 family phage prohead protease [Parvularcula sp. LCG005]WOI54802.1 HK97 family phage prohead protease [Parvularcula sp. LCG005]